MNDYPQAEYQWLDSFQLLHSGLGLACQITPSMCPSRTIPSSGISAWTGTSAPRTRLTRAIATRMSKLGYPPPLGPILDGGECAERFPRFHQFQPGGELHGQRNPPLSLPLSSTNSALDITGAYTSIVQVNPIPRRARWFLGWAACPSPALPGPTAASRIMQIYRRDTALLCRFAP